MKSFVFALLMISGPTIVFAQDSLKRKEVGLAFSNLDNFGFFYRTGTQKSLWRFYTLFASGSSNESNADSLVYRQSNSGFGLRVGREYRKSIGKNVVFRIGADLSFASNHSETKIDDKSILNNDGFQEQTTYTPGVNLVIGLNYALGKNVLVGAELLPGFSYYSGSSTRTTYAFSTSTTTTTKSDLSGFNYGLSNASALLSVALIF